MKAQFDQEAKDRHRPLKAFVSPAERLAIETKAEEAGLTVSAYLRAAALGLKIKSTRELGVTDDPVIGVVTRAGQR